MKKLAVRSSNSDGLDCINGVKVFSMFLIIFGHRIMFSLGAPIINSDYVESVSKHIYFIAFYIISKVTIK